MANTPLNQESLNQLFFDAHTHNAWLKRDVPDELLRPKRG